MSILDDLLHPFTDPKPNHDHDPGDPFTPPPSTPSPEEDEDDDGPSFPMDPALA